jgi:hypothetical protein
MNRIGRLIAILLLCGAVPGCSGEIAKPIGLDVALRGVEEDVKSASGVSLHDIVSGDSAQEGDFRRGIHHAQCFYRRANPFVPVMNKDFTLTLQGTFIGQGKFMVFGLSAPTGGVEISQAKALQQTLALPVNFTPVSSLPDVYLQQKAGYVKDIPEPKRTEYLEEVFKDRDVMRDKIHELIASYSEERCRQMQAESPSTVHPAAPAPAH